VSRSGPLNTVVTGAASGIGRHLVGALAARGDRVLAADIAEAALADARAAEGWPEDRVTLATLDVRDPAGWDGALDLAAEAHGPLDVLFNVAGVLTPAWIEDVDDASVHRQVDVNLKGVVFGTRAAARRMIPRRRGHVVNIGSLAGLTPVSGLSLYSATKFAVRGFSLSVAMELRRHGVALSVVLPDAVETPMLDLQRGREEAALTFSGDRALRPAEVVEVVLDVLTSRPLEVTVPRSRGILARVVGMEPRLGAWLEPLFRAIGRRRQR